MRMTWLAVASASLCVVTACRGVPAPGRAGSEEPSRLELVLQDIRYDGETLSGRLLLSPVDGRLRVDKRLIESASLSTRSVTDCATGQPVEFLVMDVFARRPQEEDVLLLAPGYWYGKNIRIPLFVETPNGRRSPECIEAEIVFHALGGKTAAHLRVRAERAARSAADAGPPADSSR
jgi:hypothetical protein